MHAIDKSLISKMNLLQLHRHSWRSQNLYETRMSTSSIIIVALAVVMSGAAPSLSSMDSWFYTLRGALTVLALTTAVVVQLARA
jgi:hypothetical protein